MRKLFFMLKSVIRFPINALKHNRIHYTTRVSKNVNIAKSCIGKFCYLAGNVNIVGAQIGNYVSIAPGVQIGGMEHSYWWHSTSTFLSTECISNKDTVIEDDVWIAAGSIIKQGVTIGRGAVVGAMSFVNKDVPPNSIVVGIPAKVLKKRMNEDVFHKLQISRFWEYPPSIAKKILNEI